jgi:hypothetical protein
LVISEEQIIKSALRNDFYHYRHSDQSPDSPIKSAIGYLVNNNGVRFWKVLENHLTAAQSDAAVLLLEAYVNFHLTKKKYPQKLGYGLYKLSRSLPPGFLREKVKFPLINIAKSIQLSHLAQEDDHEDVQYLFNADTKGRTTNSNTIGDYKEERKDLDAKICDLDIMLSEIDAANLSKTIGNLVDSARISYLPGSIIIDSEEDFQDTVTSFYLHLLRHTKRLAGPVDEMAASAEAYALLEKAFSKQGGISAARAEAKSGINGGLRLVLDLMTDQYKVQEQENYVNYVIKKTLDPLNWDDKVAFMRKLLGRLGENLPENALNEPERYASFYEIIVKAYAKSLDELKATLRSI